MNLICFQSIKKVYRLNKVDKDFIQLIPLTYKHSWDGKLIDLIGNGTLPANAKKKRDGIKKAIKSKLLAIQGQYCIYCGIHFDIVGTAQREHIAHKDKYPQFTFVNRNIALACAYCNGFEKKSTQNTISVLRTNYKDCEFSIVHPYFDNFNDHIGLAFNTANVIISEKNNSQKGRNTIAMFKLNNIQQSALRGAAYMRSKELKKLSPRAQKLSKAITLRKYTY